MAGFTYWYVLKNTTYNVCQKLINIIPIYDDKVAQFTTYVADFFR